MTELIETGGTICMTNFYRRRYLQFTYNYSPLLTAVVTQFTYNLPTIVLQKIHL